MPNITCPYCFQRFEDYEVHFRMEHVSDTSYTVEDMEGAEDNETRVQMWKDFFFQPRDDDAYERFWENFGRKTEETTKMEREAFSGVEVYQLPIVSPYSDAAAWCLQKQRNNGDYTDYLIYDAYGMVQGVVDIYGNETHRRVCPYCHNPLPLGYGRNEVKFISVVGVTGAGKTVYISQLLRHLPDQLAKFANMATFPADNRVTEFLKTNSIRMGEPLPNANLGKSMSQPLTYNIATSRNKVETVVIYDIAGENCADPAAMLHYGKFVVNSDGIILLIAPDQINLNTDGDAMKQDAAPPATVLNTMHAAIVAAQGGYCEKPIAICVSKSDSFAHMMGNRDITNIIRHDLEPSSDPSRTQKFFNATQYNVLEAGLAGMMEGSAVEMALRYSYRHYNYFAFSALGCDVEQTEKGSCPTHNPIPLRITEPLLWLFKRFGYMHSNEPIRLPKTRIDPPFMKPGPRTLGDKILGKPGKPIPMTQTEIEALWYEETC